MESFSTRHLIPLIDWFLIGKGIHGLPPEKSLFWGQVPISDILEKLSNATKIMIHPDFYEIWTDFLVSCATERSLVFPFQQIFIFYSDTSMSPTDLQKLQQVYGSCQIWVQNWCASLPNVHLLPIGIDALTGPMLTDPSSIHKKYPLVISYFTVNSKARIEFVDFLESHPQLAPLCVLKHMEKPVFYRFLEDFYFSVCPSGNGYDTYRFWESLSKRCVPIVKRNPFFENLAAGFPNIPMIVLESWEDLISLLPKLNETYYRSFWENNPCEFLYKDYWITKLSVPSNIPSIDARHAPHFAGDSAGEDCC